ncbi:MAG: EAL domain-containing response regulator [Candidatus Obscuribacterales bacterium]|nr:EAL domain-containing response regulator [Steroidobacteraceae bacterium]
MLDTGNRLLVVDDQPDLCEFISEAASALGFETCTTHEAEEFRRLLLEFRPTVVVMDLQMPGADGIELLRFLAKQGSRAQVLVASGMDERVLATAEQVGRSQGLNMLGTLRKPIMLADLEAVLRKTLRGELALTPADLDAAIRRHEIEVFYQPKASCVGPKRWLVDGVEALARWRHPQMGFISPARFIPLAEQHNLIRALTESVLESAMLQSREWQQAGHDLSVAINLSPQLLNDLGFPDRVDEIAERIHVERRKIVFEVTESAAMSDPAATMEVLTRLRVKNFDLSIDDFGTGYSSLKQLYLMPFGELKIDISFVRDVCTRDDARTMVEIMVLLAHKLGLKVCAEGVETQAILDHLEAAGCDRAQGYFIARPMPGVQVVQAVAEWNARQPMLQTALLKG